MFRLKKNTKILLAAPNAQVSWIIPMGGLSDLDFSLEWRDGLFKLKDDEGREIPVELRNGCPMISRQEGEKIMQWLELFYVHQWRKLAVVKTLLADASMVDLNILNLETAMTVKMKQEFPGLPDHIMMKLIPHLEMVKAEDFGARLPWNRHKRRRLLKAKRIILHIFSGPDSKYCVPQLTQRSCAWTLKDPIQRICRTRMCTASCWPCVLQAVSRPSWVVLLAGR